MQDRKLNVLIAHFPYAGNSSFKSNSIEVSRWMATAILLAEKDDRIGWIDDKDFADTPVTMTRNRAVVHAREIGADVLVMVDSDMYPDLNLCEGDPKAKPFFQTAFDALYEHYEKGPLVLAAPYTMGPPNECVCVFQWSSGESRVDNYSWKLEMIPREAAAMRTGIDPVPAIGTGLIMFDMRAFALTEARQRGRGLPERLAQPYVDQIERGTAMDASQVRDLVERCLRESQRSEEPWFYYEWTDLHKSQKASTEDVTATRDLAFAGQKLLGYNPVRVCWDCWAGHYKVKCSTKPIALTNREITEKYARAVMENHQAGMAIRHLGPASPNAEPPRDDEIMGTSTPQLGAKRLIGGHEVTTVGHATNDTDLDALRELVRRLPDPPGGGPIRICEIGGWVGESAVALAQGVGDREGCLFSIDTFEGSATDRTGQYATLWGGRDRVKQTFLENARGANPKVTIAAVRATSEMAERDWAAPDGQVFDLIFIDAAHAYEDVKADIERWLPYVREGGLLVGHDYDANEFPGVARAVQEIFGFDFSTVMGTYLWVHVAKKPQHEPSNGEVAATHEAAEAICG